MSFPDIGVAIPGPSAGSNIKFSQLRRSWGHSGYYNGLDPSSSEDGNNISLSGFDGIPLSNDTAISSESDISIGTHFCDKTFLVPVESASVSISTSTVDEESTVADFLTVSVSPDEANGTIKYEFGDSTPADPPLATPETSGVQLNDTMTYDFGSVDQDERFEEITVTIYQNVGGSDPEHEIEMTSETISGFSIRNGSGGGR